MLHRGASWISCAREIAPESLRRVLLHRGRRGPSSVPASESAGSNRRKSYAPRTPPSHAAATRVLPGDAAILPEVATECGNPIHLQLSGSDLQTGIARFVDDSGNPRPALDSL